MRGDSSPQQQVTSTAVAGMSSTLLQWVGSLSLEAKIGIVVAVAAVAIVSKFALGGSRKRGTHFSLPFPLSLSTRFLCCAYCAHVLYVFIPSYLLDVYIMVLFFLFITHTLSVLFQFPTASRGLFIFESFSVLLKSYLHLSTRPAKTKQTHYSI
jgi:hypothetical protein